MGKKRIIMPALLLMAALLAVGMCGCQEEAVPDQDVIYTEDGEIADTAIYESKIAIVTRATEVYDVYVVTQKDFDDMPDQSRQALIKYDESTRPLKENDMVLVLEETEEYCRIITLNGGAPRTRGKIDPAAISYDAELFTGANQAKLDDVAAYDAIDGQQVERVTGVGFIIERQPGWALLQFPGGADPVWVPEVDLSFDFDRQVEDADPYQIP